MRRPVLKTVTSLIGSWRGVAVMSLIAACVFVRSGDSDSSIKLDGALMALTQADTFPAVDVLVQTQPGTASAVRARITALTRWTEMMSSPDLIVAELPGGNLSRLTADPDVKHVSIDAPVKSTQMTATLLPNNLLLGTEGLLDRARERVMGQRARYQQR